MKTQQYLIYIFTGFGILSLGSGFVDPYPKCCDSNRSGYFFLKLKYIFIFAEYGTVSKRRIF